jgi:hypothetical protein
MEELERRIEKLEKREGVLESLVGWAIGFGVVAFFFLILHAYAGAHP